jgi:hypothetical protein
MSEQNPNQPPDQNSNIGLIIVLAFAIGIPLIGIIVSIFSHTPK